MSPERRLATLDYLAAVAKDWRRIGLAHRHCCSGPREET